MNELTPFKNDSKQAVIIGSGPSSVDIYNNPTFVDRRDVCLINKEGLKWDAPAKWWISYHGELFSRWYYEREAKGLPMDGLTMISSMFKGEIKHIPHYNISKPRQGLNMGGTSSLLAAVVLLDMGYEAVHLFGVDLNKGYSHERKFWRILRGNSDLIFHGDEWFHRGDFRREGRER